MYSYGYGSTVILTAVYHFGSVRGLTLNLFLSFINI